MTPVLYTAIIEWYDDTSGYLQVHWTWANTMGDALEQLRHSAESRNILHPIINEIDPSDESSPPEHAVRQGSTGNYFLKTIHQFPRTKPFCLPYGVVGSGNEGDYTTGDICEGYALEERSDGLYELTIVIDRNNVLPLYELLIRTLPDIRVFWIELSPEFEEVANSTIYVNEALATPASIIEFIEQERVDTLYNGYILLTTYDDDEATNVTITEHKVLRVLTYSKERIDACLHVLEAQGVEQQDPLITIEYGIHHWHYRYPQGRDYQAFLLWIEGKGFSLWKPE
jgi:hypothetical protein